MNTYLKWEKSAEYRALVALYLQSKTANDLHEIYKEVSTKAKTGDEKAVKLFLQLNKEVAEHAKQAVKILGDVGEAEEEDDGLIV
jgi:rubrerythrin